MSLASRLEEEIIKGTVNLEESATGYPVFTYTPKSMEEPLPLMMASSMVSELAPVVLYLRYVVGHGDVLIIEEPESHLHPEMQVEFIQYLAKVVRSGVRVLVTTHSEWVLEALANLVRLSELPAEQLERIQGADYALRHEDVGVWWFQPGQDLGGSVVRKVPLDTESGVFPVGYGFITEDLYNQWVEIDSRIRENRTDG